MDFSKQRALVEMGQPSKDIWGIVRYPIPQSNDAHDGTIETICRDKDVKATIQHNQGTPYLAVLEENQSAIDNLRRTAASELIRDAIKPASINNEFNAAGGSSTLWISVDPFKEKTVRSAFEVLGIETFRSSGVSSGIIIRDEVNVALARSIINPPKTDWGLAPVHKGLAPCTAGLR